MRRSALAGAAAFVAAAAALPLRAFVGRGTDRLLDAPRTAPDEANLGPALDALGGEVVRLTARDGLRLAGRWLPAERGDEDGWQPDPYEAILLLHGWSGSVAPDLVEFGPFLRRSAGVLGIDFRGHGGSDDGPSTFGLLEVEDVAGALAWLGERGIRRVVIFGTSMGGVTALASTVVLGDGTLAAADDDPSAPVSPAAPPRPRIVGIVADSVPADLPAPIASRLRRGPLVARRWLARRLFAEAARRLGSDLRATEPIRIVGLLESVPLLLVHGEADTTVPIAEGRRLAAAAGPRAEHWVVPAAEHSGGHAADAPGYEERVTAFVRTALSGARDSAGILAAPGVVAPSSGPRDPNVPGRVENH